LIFFNSLNIWIEKSLKITEENIEINFLNDFTKLTLRREICFKNTLL